MYGFLQVNTERIPAFNDHAFAMELLEKHHLLITPGSSFNVPYCDHFRITTLPEARQMHVVFERMEQALEGLAAGN